MTPRKSRFATRADAIAYYQRYAHGTIARYALGYCRCDACVEGGRQYRSQPRRRISSARVRRHLRELRRQGVGRRAVALACGVDQRHLQKIRSERSLITPALERKVLAVTTAARFDCGVVPGRNARRWIEQLREERYTLKAIAAGAGLNHTTVERIMRNPRLGMRACTADKIRAFYELTFKTLGDKRAPSPPARPRPIEERVRLTPERRERTGGVHPWRLADRAGFLRWQATVEKRAQR